jgi:hypothetical protein
VGVEIDAADVEPMEARKAVGVCPAGQAARVGEIGRSAA